MQFRLKMGDSNYPKPGEAIVVKYKGESKVICYGPSKSDSGWCGTCSFNQEKGKNTR